MTEFVGFKSGYVSEPDVKNLKKPQDRHIDNMLLQGSNIYVSKIHVNMIEKYM